MFDIPSLLSHSSVLKQKEVELEERKANRERIFSTNWSSSTTTTTSTTTSSANISQHRVVAAHLSIRYFAICIFQFTFIFHIPRQTLGAVIPAMTAFGDDFSDGVEACCKRHNVPDVCRRTLCNPQKPPNDFDVYDVFERRSNCSKYLKPISHCLAAGRDHSACCERDAKDGDEHTCFSMCRGQDRCLLHEAWSQYQTCLAINIRSMFECFVSGYSNAPTPPRKLFVDHVASNSVKLSWHEPAVNAHLVTRYIIYAYQLTEENEKEDEYRDSSDELYFETDERRIELGSLEAGTKYRAYAVAISDDANRSLRSKHVDFQTAGVTPRVSAFKPIVAISPNASSALLACKFKVSGVSESSVNIKWRFRKANDNSKKIAEVKGARYNQSMFLYSVSKPREHIATLKINELRADDFGAYQCTISDTFGDGIAEITLKAVELHDAPSAIPPPTPLACCRARDVEERCLPMCGGATTSSEMSARRYIARPFMPSNCSGDISKVLSCAMPEVDDSACCLQEGVPRQCMYLCDSSLEPSNQMSAVCLDHVDAVVQCRMAGVDKRPTVVAGLRIETGGAGIGASAPKTALVSWQPSKGAEIYHVYWRRKNTAAGDDTGAASSDDENSNDGGGNGGWHQISQAPTSRRVHDADEIVVVAANSYGSSQAAKIAFDADAAKWTRIS